MMGMKGKVGMKMIEKLDKHDRKIFYIIILVFLALVIGAAIGNKYKKPDWLVYADSLDSCAVRVNEKELTLRELAFYIAYDEQIVEEQAEIYNAEDTSRYWNVKTNGSYTRVIAKEATIQKAIHDEIFYQMAQDMGIVLDENDAESVEESKMMFWNSVMYGDKLERLGVTEEDINNTIEKIAIAQKCQLEYAEKDFLEMSDYDIATPWYEKILSEQDYEIYDEVWDKVQYGEVTLEHIKGVFN